MLLLRSRSIIKLIFKVRLRTLNTRRMLSSNYIMLYLRGVKAFLLTISLNYKTKLYIELKAKIIVLNKLIKVRVT